MRLDRCSGIGLVIFVECTVVGTYDFIFVVLLYHLHIRCILRRHLYHRLSRWLIRVICHLSQWLLPLDTDLRQFNVGDANGVAGNRKVVFPCAYYFRIFGWWRLRLRIVCVMWTRRNITTLVWKRIRRADKLGTSSVLDYLGSAVLSFDTFFDLFTFYFLLDEEFINLIEIHMFSLLQRYCSLQLFPAVRILHLPLNRWFSPIFEGSVNKVLFSVQFHFFVRMVFVFLARSSMAFKTILIILCSNEIIQVDHTLLAVSDLKLGLDVWFELILRKEFQVLDIVADLDEIKAFEKTCLSFLLQYHQLVLMRWLETKWCPKLHAE